MDIALQRNLRRDQSPGKSAEAITVRYLRRYLPGQRLYLEAVRPQVRSRAVIENADPQKPRLLPLDSRGVLTVRNQRSPRARKGGQPLFVNAIFIDKLRG